MAGTSGLSLAANQPGTSKEGMPSQSKPGNIKRLSNKLWQAKKRFKPLDYIRAGFRHVNDLIQNDEEEGQHDQAPETEIRRLVRQEEARNRIARPTYESRDMFATETIDLCRDDISTDSDDSFDHPSLIRVQKHYSSASSFTTGDLSDYSDADDIRNQLVDDYDMDLIRVRNDVLLGKEPKDAEEENNRPVTLSNLRESVSKHRTKVCITLLLTVPFFLIPFLQFKSAVNEQYRRLAWADRGPPEELPANIEQLIHFPMEDYVTLEPQTIFEKLLTAGAKHHIPLVFMDKMWRVICDLLEALHGERPIGFYRLRDKVIQDLPPATLHYKVQHKRTGRIRYVEGRKFRKKKYPASRYTAVVSETRTNLEDLMQYHAECHQGQRREELMKAWKEKEVIPLHFFVDGVSPSSTGSKKMI